MRTSKLIHIRPRYSRYPTVESYCVCNRFYNFSVRKILRMYILIRDTYYVSR